MTARMVPSLIAAAIVLAGALILVGPPAQSQDLVGLFQLEKGARPLAMGGAFVAMADDENALFYNPAGLSTLRELFVHGRFESRFAKVSSGTASFVLPNVGGQLAFMSVGGATRRDASGQGQGSLDYGQIGITLGGGASLDRTLGIGLPLSMGLQLRTYSVGTLPGGSGTAFSLSPSFLFREIRLEPLGIPMEKLRVGMMATDLLSPGITYGSGHAEGWGPGLRLGVAGTLTGGFTVAMDVEADGTFHLGSEWTRPHLDFGGLGLGELYVRGGIRNEGVMWKPSLGFGVRAGDLKLDYALVAHTDLPWVHRVSISYVFGTPNPVLCALELRPDVCPPDDP